LLFWSSQSFLAMPSMLGGCAPLSLQACSFCKNEVTEM
jgi:hypothetical protein